MRSSGEKNKKFLPCHVGKIKIRVKSQKSLRFKSKKSPLSPRAYFSSGSLFSFPRSSWDFGLYYLQASVSKSGEVRHLSTHSLKQMCNHHYCLVISWAFVPQALWTRCPHLLPAMVCLSSSRPATPAASARLQPFCPPPCASLQGSCSSKSHHWGRRRPGPPSHLTLDQ